MGGLLGFLAGIAGGAGRGAGAAAGAASGLILMGGLMSLIARYWMWLVPIAILGAIFDDTPRGASRETYSRVEIMNGRTMAWYDVPANLIPRSGYRPSYDVVTLVMLKNTNAESINNYQIACIVPDRDNKPYSLWQVGTLTPTPEVPRTPLYPASIPANGTLNLYVGFQAPMINGSYDYRIRDCRLIAPNGSRSLPDEMRVQNEETRRRWNVDQEAALQRSLAEQRARRGY